MYCKSCNVIYPENLVKCPNCGAKLTKESPGEVPEPEMELVKVAQLNSPIEAKIIEGLLKDSGIMVLLVGNVVQSIYPVSVNGMGYTRVLVPEERLEESIRLISEGAEDDKQACNNCGAVNRSQNIYCRSCGSELVNRSIFPTEIKNKLNEIIPPKKYSICKSCNSKNREKNEYCIICGNKLNN